MSRWGSNTRRIATTADVSATNKKIPTAPPSVIKGMFIYGGGCWCPWKLRLMLNVWRFHSVTHPHSGPCTLVWMLLRSFSLLTVLTCIATPRSEFCYEQHWRSVLIPRASITHGLNWIYGDILCSGGSHAAVCQQLLNNLACLPCFALICYKLALSLVCCRRQLY